MSIYEIPFIVNGKSYVLDVHESGKDFKILGPHVITNSLGASQFELKKKFVSGERSLVYAPASDLAASIAKKLMEYWV